MQRFDGKTLMVKFGSLYSMKTLTEGKQISKVSSIHLRTITRDRWGRKSNPRVSNPVNEHLHNSWIDIDVSRFDDDTIRRGNESSHSKTNNSKT